MHHLTWPSVGVDTIFQNYKYNPNAVEFEISPHNPQQPPSNV